MNVGSRVVAYYVNWAIYARDHPPQDLPANCLTHVLYAFANIRPTSGEVFLTDTWSDIEKHYPTDSWNDPGVNIYGCLKQMALHKRRNRNFKSLLSIGGWTYSVNFPGATQSEANRRTFARSAVEILKNCGFDGIDIDWEYPANDQQAENYVALLKAVREELAKYATYTGQQEEQFLLTVACPAGLTNYEKLRIREMDEYLDFWNMMAYDYAGSWGSCAGHQANVDSSTSIPAATPFNTIDAVNHYWSQGVKANKIVIGCPLYGRAFVGTDGPGQVYTGGIGSGSWENGVWDWKALPLKDSNGKLHTVCYDEECTASWTYDDATKTMISYDDERVQLAKAKWIMETGLGGIMWWESSGDKKATEGGVIGMVSDCLSGGPAGMEVRQNTIDYPLSKYDNMRNGFPGEV